MLRKRGGAPLGLPPCGRGFDDPAAPQVQQGAHQPDGGKRDHVLQQHTPQRVVCKVSRKQIPRVLLKVQAGPLSFVDKSLQGLLQVFEHGVVRARNLSMVDGNLCLQLLCCERITTDEPTRQ